MYRTALQQAINRACGLFTPPEPLQLSEWADRYAYLSPESSAEVGKWRTYSFQRGIMDEISNPYVETVVLMKSARVGYTKMLNWDTAYHIQHDPCSQLIVQPTIEDAQGYSKDEIAPMLRDMLCLEGLVAEVKSRDSKNTILKKSFPGGVLNIVGANAPRGFRRITVRRVKFDEVDGYPMAAGKEGDQIGLGMKRAETFWDRKFIIGSTPTVRHASKVEQWFEKSDRRYFMIRCPNCGSRQRLKFRIDKDYDREFGFENISVMRWPQDEPEKAYFVCGKCAGEIPQQKRMAVIDSGEWVASQPQVTNCAGFHIWAAYSFSPGASWGSIARRFYDANAWYKDTGDYEPLKTVINTDFGETWELRGKGVDSISLESRKEDFEETDIPDGVKFITMGVDVQGDRIELEIVGWSEDINPESWSIDYVILYGNPQESPVWEKLDDEIGREFRRSGAYLRIAATAIDSGDNTQSVYDFVGPRQHRRVFAVKGDNQLGVPIVSKYTLQGNRKDIKLFRVGTDTAKDKIYHNLEVESGPGYCHFPDDYDDEYFAQLTAEKVVIEKVRGNLVRKYKKTRKRNEALDCRVYALAALYIVRPPISELRRRRRRVISRGVNAQGK